jgi:hypothetical protein
LPGSSFASLTSFLPVHSGSPPPLAVFPGLGGLLKRLQCALLIVTAYSGGALA